MTDGLLALVVKSQSNVAQSTASSYNSCVCFLVNSHTVEAAHVDNQMSIFASKTM